MYDENFKQETKMLLIDSFIGSLSGFAFYRFFIEFIEYFGRCYKGFAHVDCIESSMTLWNAIPSSQ